MADGWSPDRRIRRPYIQSGDSPVAMATLCLSLVPSSFAASTDGWEATSCAPSRQTSIHVMLDARASKPKSWKQIRIPYPLSPNYFAFVTCPFLLGTVSLIPDQVRQRIEAFWSRRQRLSPSIVANQQDVRLSLLLASLPSSLSVASHTFLFRRLLRLLVPVMAGRDDDCGLTSPKPLFRLSIHVSILWQQQLEDNEFFGLHLFRTNLATYQEREKSSSFIWISEIPEGLNDI